MKKILAALNLSVLMFFILAGCAANPSSAKSDFNDSNEIKVVSREDGSGTRGAFIELFGIQVKNDDGSKKDKTTKEATIAKQTDVMMTNISGDKYSIGYISLGSLNDTVKALDIDGATASFETVKNRSYTVSRPFNIATKGAVSELAQDFIDYILSADGQAVVSKSYISINDSAPAFSGGKISGKIVVAGSTSVTPIMEKLKEAYLLINKDAKIEIQSTDSTSGITGAIEGTCDIGMSSRALKDTEKESLTETTIAIDGISVIVNNANPLTNLTKDQVKSIFTGEVITWSDLSK